MSEFITNEERAERARKALDACDLQEDDIEDGIVDLMADLLHLINQQTGLDIDQVLDTARMHYEAEIADTSQ